MHKRKSINEISNLLEISNKITTFIKIYLDKIKDFEKNSIITYFLTLRHLIIHGEITNFLTETDDGLRFTEEILSFLIDHEGGFIVDHEGGRIITKRGDSIFSIYPLSQLSEKEKENLQKKLSETDPIDLMTELLKKFELLKKEFSEISI